MTRVVEPSTNAWTAADLVERFGAIPLWRIRFDPLPGQATEEDVVRINEKEERLCELVDGVLVEKTVGTYESYLAVSIARALANFVGSRRLGVVLGADGMMRLMPGLVRIPDVSFISLGRLPGGRVPRTPLAELAPDLAVEVLSPSNTPEEMRRKLEDYFRAGVRLVWYVHPDRREVHVYTSPETVTVFGPEEKLTGGDVLSGFEVRVADLFAEPGEPSERSAGRPQS